METEIKLKKVAFGNKDRITDRKWDSRFFRLFRSINEVRNTAYTL